MFIGVSQSYIAYTEFKQNHVLDLIHFIWSVLKGDLNPPKYTQAKTQSQAAVLSTK